MIQFANTCIDDFFNNPDAVREYADGLAYHVDQDGRFPGQRSGELHRIDSDFYNFTCEKYLRNFYTGEQMKSMAFRALAYFQKIKGDYGSGWVHNDVPYLHTTIIYLTPDASPSEGTSLFIPNKLILAAKNSDAKRKFFKGEIDVKDMEKHRLESGKDFTETMRFANVYNRCIGFDSSQWHCANSLDRGERLTLIIFWLEIIGPQTGLQRIKMGVL